MRFRNPDKVVIPMAAAEYEQPELGQIAEF